MREPVAHSLLIAAALAFGPCAGCHSACQVASCRPFSADCELAHIAEAPATAERALRQAHQARRHGDPQSPDLYYQAAVLSWRDLAGGETSSAWRTYHQSVAGLIEEGARQGRFASCGELTVHYAGRKLAVPLACLGLPWEPADVSELYVAERPHHPKLANYHACDGLGVPLVAVRAAGHRTTTSCGGLSAPYLPPRLPFAATAVLRPGADGAAVLELYNPLRVANAGLHGRSVALARDTSAPLEYRLRTGEQSGMLGFLDPGQAGPDGLRFLEPYQPGKIPVVFVHGLLSDPSAWIDVANELRSQPWFNEHYQIWGFRYATGKPFVTSAMLLRRQSGEALARLDAEGQDKALRQMVLVGHSMGGLVSKLQVSYSEEKIWASFASAPLDSLIATTRAKAELAERVYFDPQPAFRRVVFIATPHGGSSWAARGLGRVSSALVEPAPQAEALHDELVAANPGVFSRQFERRVPTSIDLLEPQDPTLQAIRTLRVSPCVTLHSIIGTCRASLADGPGDGVVSANSARHANVASERFVDGRHTTILKHPDTNDEIQRILREHLGENVP